MPLLDIATAQPSFQNNFTPRAQLFIHDKAAGKFTFGNEKGLASPWKSFQIPKKVNFNVGQLEMQRGELLIKAVATLEPKHFVHSEDGHKNCNAFKLCIDTSSLVNQLQSSSEESTKLDERERLRRIRISKANKGNIPWNKGRKHSAETRLRIRERTKLAMQDPKVKMKLAKLGHAQSKETRLKIGVGVRIGWQRRRKKLMLQETCYFEWQNLIAEASRRGYVGEEELQWDSYKILSEQLEQEWLESVKQRKMMRRPKGSKRAPKSPEQRRKISEAISAKWADPGYRERVYSALSKYHGTQVGVKKKPRRRPSGDQQSRRRSPAKTKSSNTSAGMETKRQTPQFKLKRSNAPPFKDPLVGSKLEMIKKIKAQRAAAETKKTEAIERARLLIAEAEKAAKALEEAATRSPLAQASLVETRKLIAEAIQSIESIDATQNRSDERGIYPSSQTSVANRVEKQLDGVDGIKVNGAQALTTNKNDDNFDFGNFTLQNFLNEEELLPASSSMYGFSSLELDNLIKQSISIKQPGQLEQNGDTRLEEGLLLNGAKCQSMKEEVPSNAVTVTKKWVRGRLVEVAEGD